MRILKKMRKAYAVYWEPRGKNQFGENVYELPVEIRCRWDDCQEELLDVDDKPVFFDSMVFVDRIVKVGGLLYSGKLVELTSTIPTKDAKRIRKFDLIPTLRYTHFAYIAYL